ncbi:MAG: AAA family ATPase [Coleofasciculus sp. G1-WW12-02]|uniref:AAA family ATPase n=1 Tax=Coleofasciculus sp. G1-WW12-02 TaxID=3068483 RepID=UPI0032F88DAF
MIVLPGYQILAKIYESSNSLVYRGIRQLDTQPVILKVLKSDYPTSEELNRYKSEYEITHHWRLEGVIHSYDLLAYQNTWVIVFEDIGGESLKLLVNKIELSLSDILDIAIKITEGLGAIHAANTIHKDINPSNIIFNPATGQIKIIDFGIAIRLSRENYPPKQSPSLEGTLAYLSPEQTGRMDCPLDYRTDFYSLGVTLYELLTHHLPFDKDEPMELIYCHLAQQPLPPHVTLQSKVVDGEDKGAEDQTIWGAGEAEKTNLKLKTQNFLNRQSLCPKAISNIIMKLLEKMPQRRYQSATGLKADLEHCREQLKTTGIIQEFPLGYHDQGKSLPIPQKLYGREREIKTLLAAFFRLACFPKNQVVRNHPNGQLEIILLTGYAGVGKSSLVHQVRPAIIQQGSYFISGKFDQFQCNIPYSALVNAFSKLIRQILTESEAKLRQWREKLLESLGRNGQIIIEVIPQVELIIGTQPEVSELGLAESKNRFHLVFQAFMRVFCQPEHPLVIFLDDLQWADVATLKLLESILTDDQIHHLLLIGAYRDNEVDPSHPLMISLDTICSVGISINQIILNPLNREQVISLISETLHQDEQAVTPLAELVLRKTAGNPFFIKEFIKTLAQENLIFFSPSPCGKSGQWTWDINQIEETAITDNVVKLMIEKLKKLPETTQQVLGLAACMGNYFQLDLVARIYEKIPDETFGDLIPAIQLGLIEPKSKNSETNFNLIQYYKFSHDRVQQAVDALMDKAMKEAVHWKIGRLLLANLSPSQKYERIFDIVDHLNWKCHAITDNQERLELTRLNLAAAKKAKLATAYIAARDYLNLSLLTLSKTSWNDQYILTFKIHKELAEIEYLNGNFEQSHYLINQTLIKASSTVEQAELYNLLIVQYTMLANYEEAIRVGSQALKQLGIDFPSANWKRALDREVADLKFYLGDREIASLIDLPDMTDVVKKAAVKLLLSLDPPTYFLDQDIYAWVTVKLVNLSLQYGNAPESSKGYSNYGLLLGSLWGDYQGGYAFGLLACQLSKTYNNPVYIGRTHHFFATFLNPWIKPIQCAEFINRDAYEAGMEAGDFQYVGYTLNNQLYNAFNQGSNLTNVLIQTHKILRFSRKTQNKWVTDMILACQLPVFNLSGKTENKWAFDTDEISEAHYLDTCHTHHTFSGICTFYSIKAWVLYLYNKPEAALTSIKKAEKYLPFILGLLTQAEYNFYTSLILAALYTKATDSQQTDYWQTLIINQNQMKNWAENCPENFLHKYVLIDAEMAQISGQTDKAMDLYDRAIALAKTNEFTHHEALGNELAAKFWLSKGKVDFAKLYLQKARHGYQHWGAQRKVEELEKTYPHLLTEALASVKIKDTLTNSPMDSVSGNYLAAVLDFSTIVKTFQALSSEMALDKLLTSLMKILIENAGATQGVLILDREGQLLIEATYRGNLDNIAVLQSIPLESSQDIPTAIIHYVNRTQELLVLNDATSEDKFITDAYIQHNQPKSIVCAPLLNQGQLIGLFYLENNLATGAFTPERVELLHLISAQAAISIKNARLWQKQAELNHSLQSEIAERKSTEIALRKSEGLYRTLTQNFPNGSVLLFDQNLRFLLAEGEGVRAGGFEPEQLKGKTITDVLSPDVCKIIEPLYQSALAGETKVSEMKFADRTHQLYTLPVKNERGEIFAGMVMSQDITLQKQAEHVLQNAREELERQVEERTKALIAMNSVLQAEIAERRDAEVKLKELTQELQRSNQELEQFAYIASHDLQEPLRAVASYTQLLQQDYLDQLDESAQDYMAFIIDGATRMRQLIQALLMYSRLGTRPPEEKPTDCNAILRQVTENLQVAIAERQGTITYNSLPTVPADPTQLIQLFQNLIGNAIKFCRERPPHVHIEAQLIENAWLFQVKDNGIGIKPKYLDRIFVIFKRLHTRREFSGTGIGLAVCKKIVERHGGRIWVESQPGVGSTFFFTLPCLISSNEQPL